MIRLKSFTQMLDEKTVSKEECVKRFEKFVFGEVLGKKEKDTKIEARIFDALYSFFFAGDNSSKIGGEKATRIITAIKKLLECKKYFNILKETKKPYIYRGMTMTEKDIIPIIKKSKTLTLEPDDLWDVHHSLNTEMKYTPFSGAQSWTTNLNVARQFAAKGEGSGQVEVILKLDVKKNRDSLLFRGDITNRIKKKARLGFGNEDEVIRVGNAVKVEVVMDKRIYDRIKEDL
jgi:hypothetical protein